MIERGVISFADLVELASVAQARENDEVRCEGQVTLLGMAMWVGLRW